MKKVIDLWRKIRKPIARPTEVHVDKKKYSRREKYKKSSE